MEINIFVIFQNKSRTLECVCAFVLFFASQRMRPTLSKTNFIIVDLANLAF